ncbi:ABC transporter ATP-binding protein [Cytobacillus sp. FJAT-54145]|uniref:ABC transporter ATP-binding protein n=1 Tax=Cytobacillus spartinae TaxID=3299023 RepID=A0ABW6KGI5_9BACI
MITIENVSKKYGSEYTIKDISIRLEKGKIYGLLGPNGSGKSTTLKLIAGLVHPTTGKVFVDGRQVSRRIASDVAYLTELDMFYASFTVQNTIDFSASQFSDFDVNKAEELLKFMELSPNKKVRTLSKGNRGRLKLVIALARKTPVLLLDEPFSGLDPMVRESIVRGLLNYIDFENQTVVIATHEIDEIESLLDEVMIIQNGRILAQRNVEEVRETDGLSILEWMKVTFQQREDN